MMYRVTIPGRYGVGTPGHSDPSSRQGHYTEASTPAQAAERVRARLSLPDSAAVDVQEWEKASGPHPVTRVESSEAGWKGKAPAALAVEDIRAAVERDGLTVEGAAREWARLNPRLASRVLDDIGSWRSSEPELAALQRVLT